MSKDKRIQVSIEADARQALMVLDKAHRASLVVWIVATLRSYGIPEHEAEPIAECLVDEWPDAVRPVLSIPVDQRPWQKGDADSRCQNCGRAYQPWFTDHWLWNRVLGGPQATEGQGGFLCPICFQVAADREYDARLIWRFTPEWQPTPKPEPVPEWERPLLQPSKPPEPRGIGAVVQDSHGERYVQVEPLGGVWRCVRTTLAFRWDSLPIVAVLSEGVSATEAAS